MTEMSNTHPWIPSPPRAVSRRAARRAWAEAGVQIWWKCAIVVAVVMIYVTAVQVQDHLAEQRLLNKGVLVHARVVQLADRKIGTGSYRPTRENDLDVKLDGFPDGKIHDGKLPKGEGFAELGGRLELRADPNDLDHWVEVKPEGSFARELIAIYLLAPAIVLLLAIAQWKRLAVLKVWRVGEVTTGVIVDSKHSSISPRSRNCRYMIADSSDRRVFTMLHPNSHGLLREGDALNMIMLPGQAEKAIVADLYIEPTGEIGSGETAVSAAPSGEVTSGEMT